MADSQENQQKLFDDDEEKVENQNEENNEQEKQADENQEEVKNDAQNQNQYPPMYSYMEQNQQQTDTTYQYQKENVKGQKGDDDVFIQVCDPIKKQGISNYIVYTVKGQDKDGPYEVHRRYSEFAVLREILIQRWPGVYIPPIPPKKKLGNLEAKFIEDRRRFLEEFAKRIGTVKYIYYSEEFQTFLRQQSGDIEKTMKNFKNHSHEELIQKYQQNFQQLSGKEINTDLILKITTFKNYLAKVGSMLNNFKQMAKNCAKERRSFNEKFNTFINYLMPDYEKNCFIEYVQGGEEKFVFGNTNDPKLNQFINKIKENSNYSTAFEEMSDLIKQDIAEITAFNDAMNSKRSYEVLKEKAIQKQKETQLELQKLLAGKKTFASIIQTGSKENQQDKLEKQINSLQKDIESLSFICDIIVVILGYIEIDRFKSDKTTLYYKTLKKMAKLEQDYSQNMQELWAYIAENSNVMLEQCEEQF